MGLHTLCPALGNYLRKRRMCWLPFAFALGGSGGALQRHPLPSFVEMSRDTTINWCGGDKINNLLSGRRLSKKENKKEKFGSSSLSLNHPEMI